MPAVMRAKRNRIFTAGRPLAQEWADGTKEWYRDVPLHLKDGPAFEGSKGTSIWFRRGFRHREGDPAIENEDGTADWYLHGRKVTLEEVLPQTPGM
jgi:hypothetical protein